MSAKAFALPVLSIPCAGLIAAGIGYGAANLYGDVAVGPSDVLRPLSVWLPVTVWGVGKVVAARWFGWPMAATVGLIGVAIALGITPATPVADLVMGTLWAAWIAVAAWWAAQRSRRKAVRP